MPAYFNSVLTSCTVVTLITQVPGSQLKMVTASPKAAAAAAATSSKGVALPNAAMTASPVGGKGYRLLQPTKKDLQCLPDIWDFMVKQCPDQTAVS
jgi:hypothetical protein